MLKRHWRLLVRVPLLIIWLGVLLRLSYLGGDIPELATWDEKETWGAITYAIFTIVLWTLPSRIVTLNPAKDPIDASSSQLRQEYTNESAQLKPTPAALDRLGANQPDLTGFTDLARQVALRTLRNSQLPSSMEVDQTDLAHLWAEMVISHYSELAQLAQFDKISIDNDTAARLLRQVCNFYNVLWWHRLHQRILDTRRVAREDIPQYIDGYKEATLVTLVMHPDMPITPNEMPIFTHPIESQNDHLFYSKGTLSSAGEEDDFSKVLMSIGQERDGTFAEIIARLHFRTIQVLDLSHKMSLFGMQGWWRLHLELAEQNLSLILNQLVPVPEK
jgi:hypothetical protein